MTPDRSKIEAFRNAESIRFSESRPRSLALADASRDHYLSGYPLHWMSDWPLPFAPFVERAEGAELWDVDGHHYFDFCLGDTGAMFGHSPPAVVEALREQAGRGLTTMLPSPRAASVGAKLEALFGLPTWNFTHSATDANRAAIRWARAVTDQPVLLVFDGCYHGSLDDTLVRWHKGRTVARGGMVGQVGHPAVLTRVAKFNDVTSLTNSLSTKNVAAVLFEPAMTNIGLVQPDPGFLDTLREMTRALGTLLIVDETHTLSAGPGGASKAWGLEPDMITVGKAIAGGFPCGLLGLSADVAARVRAYQPPKGEAEGHGHSAMGTTLAGNPMALAGLEASLDHLMTADNYAGMLSRAAALEADIQALLTRRGLPWCTSRIGARLEIQFCPTPPRNAPEAVEAFDDELQAALHLGLANRGVLVTPFHHMLLISPATTEAACAHFVATLDQVLELLS